jgi:molybdopterin converting factor small subunit
VNGDTEEIKGENMNINVKTMGLLKLDGIKNGSDIEIADGTTISSFMDRYVTKKEHHKFVMVTVNEKKVELSYELQDSDRLSMFLPFGAG